MSLKPKARRYSRISPNRSDSSFISPSIDENLNNNNVDNLSESIESTLDLTNSNLSSESNINQINNPESIRHSILSKFNNSPSITPEISSEYVSPSPQLINENLKIATTSSYIPPWTEPYIIGIAGNSGSGKTSISQQIIQGINQPWTVLLSFDNFYKSLTPEESEKAFENEHDFDKPDALDLDAVVETIQNLKKGGKAIIPVYSFAKHSRTERTNTIYGANVVIVEGLYALYDERLLSMMDLKIYVDTDLDICLSRRLIRDILYRGRDLKGTIKQWQYFVKPNAVKYINPTKDNADLIIPRGLDNSIAINLMIKHIKNQLILKSRKHIQNLKNLGQTTSFKVEDYPNLKILPITNQLRGINSLILDINTSRNDFIFYFHRVSGILIEFTQMNFFKYDPIQIKTMSGYEFKGLKSIQNQQVAISIIRSGDCFMTPLKKTYPELTVGKMLIQSDSSTGEPQLHFESLPRNINEIGKIMLFDSQIISGAGAIMAIQVLIDHKVLENDIIFISYLSTEIGIRRILNVYPNVNLVIGKLSSIEEIKGDNDDSKDIPWYNEEKFCDTNWHFRNRFIDSLYFGTD
ncbi:URK1 [Candida pseudojiufengensis]|uniref:URK1 n=1 Tax=Candida pseudojiufengensis TaxID=497109 RepID=UPI0022255BBC|nr:URK1 [Candida pseudojiufengensis]KAI5965147.1 URK1 [Candida pseudojiufengensis]